MALNKALCAPQHLKDIVPTSGFDTKKIAQFSTPWKKCLSMLAV